MNENYKELLYDIKKFKKELIITLSNIFTMRQIGNKTHGDMAEIALTEFINTYLGDKYIAEHVGKDLFRKKSKEEDITVKNKITGEYISISIKAYGNGPLQLSTDKDFTIFPMLESYNKDEITDEKTIKEIINKKEFINILKINILPLIYNEENNTCNILIFDFNSAILKIKKIKKINSDKKRKYPIYEFLDADNNYLFEVRYGGANANALQRGVWTNTKNAYKEFISLTDGWIEYEDNLELLKIIQKEFLLNKEEIKKYNEEFFND